MFFIFQINFIIFFVSFLNIYSKEDVLYTPYSDYKNPSINSIYGTGNRTLDVQNYAEKKHMTIRTVVKVTL